MSQLQSEDSNLGPLVIGVEHAARGLCAWAVAVVWDMAAQRLLAYMVACENVPAPYRPGRLAYCVSPAISAALLPLLDRFVPNAVLIHGHGLAHPRGFGLACHVGLMHRVKTVGVAEKLLVGEHEKVPAKRAEWRPVIVNAKPIGAALRTRAEAKVLYISPGWMCDVDEAVDLVMACIRRYRWPEPLRHARMRLHSAIRHRLEFHTPGRKKSRPAVRRLE